MENFFIILLLIGIVGLIVGIKNPERVKVSSKKKVLQIFVPLIVVSFIAFGVTADSTDEESSEEEDLEASEVKEETTEDDEEDNDEEIETEDVNEDTEETSIDELETEEATDEIEEEITDNEQEAKEDASESDQKAMEDLAITILEENFSSMADVSLDRDIQTFYLTPTDQAFIDELVYMVETETVLDDWDFLVSGFKEMSGSLHNSLGSGYTIQLVNPMNEENTILTLIDGQVIYDAFDAFK